MLNFSKMKKFRDTREISITLKTNVRAPDFSLSG